MAPQSNLYKQKAKGQFRSQQVAKRLSKIKKNYQDIHAKTYNDRNSKPQQKHRLGKVSKNITWGLNWFLRGHNRRP